MNFGANYDFAKSFSAGVRYTAGVSDLYKKELDEKGKNNNLALTVAYKF